jgi:hypothetical protein
MAKKKPSKKAPPAPVARRKAKTKQKGKLPSFGAGMPGLGGQPGMGGGGGGLP